MYNVVESVRVGACVCILCVFVVPIYIVKYVDDIIHGIIIPECCVPMLNDVEISENS